jgi:8-oxo-dGTP diphosphatase
MGASLKHAKAIGAERKLQFMLKYTICLIRQGDNVLLLNRRYAPWMGYWNGVGGKIDPGESPVQSVLREIFEETGLDLSDVRDKGVVTWTSDGVATGGMHAFIAELPASVRYPTPKLTDEGILDWKPIEWIEHPDNSGVAHNIPCILRKMLDDPNRYDHRCAFVRDRLVGVESLELT